MRRVLLYRESLLRLQALGVKRVFSYTLGEETGISAELVRQDLAEYNIRGNRRGGYNVDDVIRVMETFFFGKEDQDIIIVGRGNIGSALANYDKFIRRRINIVASFDIDPSKFRIRSEIPVYEMGRLGEIIDRFNVRTAIIAVPDIAAQSVCDRLVNLGIEGIVNFAPVILKVPSHIIVNNVNLSDEIECVTFGVAHRNNS